MIIIHVDNSGAATDYSANCDAFPPEFFKYNVFFKHLYVT